MTAGAECDHYCPSSISLVFSATGELSLPKSGRSGRRFPLDFSRIFRRLECVRVKGFKKGSFAPIFLELNRPGFI